ncbi:MAG: hypothetical protein AMJ62_12230 [Myxococcales bacterium SG8_38]|nr:MAG: hypothetical protein AMJ62_12230 [Myxococcales bacterium SG8_38]
MLGLLIVGCDSAATEPMTDGEPIGSLNLIPMPTMIFGDAGHLILDADARISVAAGLFAVGEELAEGLRPATGWRWEVTSDNPSPGDIALVLDAARTDLGDEGYALIVDERRVTVLAAAPAGVFYGSQTLRQLLPAEIESSTTVEGAVWRIPMVTIEDVPRFEWRGVMLDVARHFFDVEEVMRVVDLAARYKLNRFHLHLTDDSGWRIEIDAWPDLTAIGATTDYSGGDGGFFTKEDFVDIVAYAEARFVTIVPEINMPGHTNAALASYAELNESGERTELTPTVPFGSSSLWIDGPETARFVEEVIEEVTALVPGRYFHIGGDEALATEPDDYAAFIAMAQKVVESQGKIMVGWEEIGRADLAPPFVAQHWLRREDARAARDKGARIIASPASNAYLDMKYDASTPIGLVWAGFTDVRDAYEWDPVPPGFIESDVMGVEAPLWTETIDDMGDVELMMFPRLLGCAELGWSRPEDLEWEAYRARLAAHGPRLAAHGVNFYRSPLVDWLP